MVSTLLKYFEDIPQIGFLLKDNFPLAKATGVPQAFEGEEPNWDMLREQFGDAIYINRGTKNEWREVSVATPYNLDKRMIPSGRLLRVPGQKIDSFSVQAHRRGALEDFSWMETGQYCFALTPDGNNIIVGTRGGSESVGEVIALPVGSVEYNQISDGRDLALEATIKEGYEEGVIQEHEWDFIRPLGIYRQEPGSTAPSNIFMYLGQLNIPFEEV